MEALTVDDFDENPADAATRGKAGQYAAAGDEAAFERQHGADLSARHAEVAQHAEFAPPCRRQRREARRHAGEADADRHRLDQVGDQEGAVEDGQADAANLAG